MVSVVSVSDDLTVFEALADAPWADLMLGGVTLPPLPPERLQRDWCGNAGVPLAQQSGEFYSLVKALYARYSRKPLRQSRLLDFGCGWGRLTRLFSKDLPSSQIFGCDSDSQILEWCKHIPGTFRPSETRLRQLPFDEPFDLMFAFSVFTHLGPQTHDSALTVLHDSLAPEGILVATIRPRSFLEIHGGELSTLSDAVHHKLLAAYDAGEFVYHPYNLLPVDGEVPYGEAVIPRAYVHKSWTDRFEILAEPPSSPSDPYQRLVVMRRRRRSR
jgi:2-polyprenyl-3-methyl-5-hydroxy-6-metoxy-1,4-benzoquinol methylase